MATPGAMPRANWMQGTGLWWQKEPWASVSLPLGTVHQSCGPKWTKAPCVRQELGLFLRCLLPLTTHPAELRVVGWGG